MCRVKYIVVLTRCYREVGGKLLTFPRGKMLNSGTWHCGRPLKKPPEVVSKILLWGVCGYGKREGGV